MRDLNWWNVLPGKQNLEWTGITCGGSLDGMKAAFQNLNTSPSPVHPWGDIPRIWDNMTFPYISIVRE